MLNITFGEVISEDVGQRDDVSLSKFMRLSQLIIEYLLYSQDYYRSQVSFLDGKFQDLNTKVRQRAR